MVSFTLVNSVVSFTLVNPGPSTRDRFVYAVKFICNPYFVGSAVTLGLVEGLYRTDINIHNPSFQKQNASIVKKFVLAVPEPLSPGTAGKVPYIPATPNPYVLQTVMLGPDAAMRTECGEVLGLLSPVLVPSAPACPAGDPVSCATTAKGFIIIYSTIKLDVVAEYTAETALGGISIDTQYIQSQTFTP